MSIENILLVRTKEIILLICKKIRCDTLDTEQNFNIKRAGVFLKFIDQS